MSVRVQVPGTGTMLAVAFALTLNWPVLLFP